jgi:hypothetical protein
LFIYPNILIELFPNKEETKPYRKKGEEVPTKLVDFVNILNITNSNILPSFKNTNYKIKLQPRIIPLVGPIYPLSYYKIMILRKYIAKNLAKS